MVGLLQSHGPFFPLALGSASLAALILVVAVVLTLLGRRPPRLLAVLSVATPLLFLALGWRASAAAITTALRTPDSMEQARLLMQGLSGQMVLAVAAGMIVLALATLLATLLIASFARKERMSAAMVLGGLLGAIGAVLLAVAILRSQVGLVTAFASFGTVDPSEKPRVLLAAFDAARPAFTVVFMVALPAVIAALGVAAVAAPRGPWSAADRFYVGVCVVLGVALLAETRPFARENAAPPIEPSLGIRSSGPTPALVGPDPIERAPLLRVDGGASARYSLEGSAVPDATSLGERLAEFRKVDQLLRPDAPFTGRILLSVAPGVSTATLAPALSAIRAAGYVHPTLVFGGEEILARPVFGTVRRVRTTGARVRLDAGEGDRIALGERRFEVLAAEVVGAREAGREVSLALE